MKIAFIGKFANLHDEEYIALSFQMIGCEVRRIPQHYSWIDIKEILLAFRPDILLYTKWEPEPALLPTLNILKREGMKTVCWLFDLYFDYHRENLVKSRSYFRSDYVFTTDGGHQHRFDKLGINHKCVRQGIYRPECLLFPFKPIKNEIVFVGSDNPIYPERSKLIKDLNAIWFGRKNTNEMRGIALNELYSESRIIIGDSFPSDYYWSNRVVETLGRGGFLIHKEVEGIKEAFPYLVTYKDEKELKIKIEFYRKNEKKRRDNIIVNQAFVLNNCTMEKRCAEILQWIK